MSGCRSLHPGFEGIRSVMGSMGRSVVDLELMNKVAFKGSEKLWQSNGMLPVPFREFDPKQGREGGKLKFGYYTLDDFVKTSPACIRAVMKSVEALINAGHEVIEIEPPSGQFTICIRSNISEAKMELTVVKAMEIFVALSSADGKPLIYTFKLAVLR